jgi:hypothetical protein
VIKTLKLDELKLGDKVEYLWVGAWRAFVVCGIASSLADRAPGALVNYKVTLYSPELAREAYVNRSHVQRNEIRWPRSPEDQTVALRARLEQLEQTASALYAEICAARKELAP